MELDSAGFLVELHLAEGWLVLFLAHGVLPGRLLVVLEMSWILNFAVEKMKSGRRKSKVIFNFFYSLTLPSALSYTMVLGLDKKKLLAT